MPKLLLGFGAIIALALTVGTAVFLSSRSSSAPEDFVSWPPPLSDSAAREQLEARCENARRSERLLLVEFSAPWCEQCQAVKAALNDDVQDALRRVEAVTVNIGDGRELDAIRLELGARAIPYWALVEPTRCNQPAQEWPRVASMNPRPVPAELASWLRNAPP